MNQIEAEACRVLQEGICNGNETAEEIIRYLLSAPIPENIFPSFYEEYGIKLYESATFKDALDIAIKNKKGRRKGNVKDND